jgi:hypothetical protein
MHPLSISDFVAVTPIFNIWEACSIDSVPSTAANRLSADSCAADGELDECFKSTMAWGLLVLSICAGRSKWPKEFLNRRFSKEDAPARANLTLESQR